MNEIISAKENIVSYIFKALDFTKIIIGKFETILPEGFVYLLDNLVPISDVEHLLIED